MLRISKKISNDIKVEFGLDKFAVLHIEKGNVVNSLLLSDILSLSIEYAYKYVGISEVSDILHTEIKTKSIKKNIQRKRVIINANLIACNTSQTINGFALPSLHYGFWFINWTKAELMRLYKQVRKLLTNFFYHHPKSNPHQLRMSRMEGGRGIVSILD